MIKNHIAYSTFADWKFRVAKAQGSYIWDEDGRKLIDFTSGWNVTNLGWNSQEINQAMIRHIKNDTVFTMGSESHPVQEEYSDALLTALPNGLNTVFRATGGTEANEVALKIAWAATGKKKIIGFNDCYHGESYAVVQASYRAAYIDAIFPKHPAFIKLDFPAVTDGEESKETLSTFCTKLEQTLKKRDVAAVLTEPGIITGWGSTIIAPQGFCQAVRKLTQEYGTLLIFDEVGTGFSRLGKLFGMELERVVPDIVTLAKGISNGAMPIGATVTSTALAQRTIDKTSFYSTFGWTPLACTAALQTLTIHQREKIWEKAEISGKYLLSTLRKALINHPKVKSIRGIGMEIGFTLDSDMTTHKVIQKARDNGLYLINGGGGNIQIMPPLTSERDVLDKGIDILVGVVEQMGR